MSFDARAQLESVMVSSSSSAASVLVADVLSGFEDAPGRNHSKNNQSNNKNINVIKVTV